MKSTRMACITTTALFVVLATPVQLSAQHARYKLIDIGTLGGPASYQSGFGNGEHLLSERGIAAGYADTSTPDPNCIQPDCFVSHGFKWDKGTIRDLGVLPGGIYSGANEINTHGWIAGFSELGEVDPVSGTLAGHGVLWKKGEMLDLGTLGTGVDSNAIYVTNGGEAIGFSTVDTVPDPFFFLGSVHPFIWKNGVMRDLGTLGGPDAGPANGCDLQRGDLVAGWSFTDSTPNSATGVPTQHAFLWENGTMVNIPTLGGTYAYGQCANNRGQVVGQSSLVGDVGCDPADPFNNCLQHPFLWDHGTLTDLGSLGGDYSIASWLNNAGEAVGFSFTLNYELFHAALWKDGSIRDLGAPADDCFSLAAAINARHQIVGRSFSCDFSILRAVLWDEEVPIDLNSLIPKKSSLQLVEAVDINDRGEIFGRGLPAGCDNEDLCGHDFVLVPCGSGNTPGCDGNSANDARSGSTAMTGSASAAQRSKLTAAFVAKLRTRLNQPHRFPSRKLSK